MHDLPGVMPALVTPFTRDGELDLEAHVFNLVTLSDRGVEGFLLGGSTGEGPYLEPGERRLLVETSRSALGDGVLLLAGIMGETVRTALAQIEEAEAGGADAVLVLTPTSLVRGDGEAVAGFYRLVADRSPLAVLLYSVPGYTAYELPVEIASELAGHDNVAGMKDSGGHPVRIARIAESVEPTGFSLYAGASAALALSMEAGAHGAITASANYVPELVRAVVETDGTQRARHQRRLRELTAIIEAWRIPGVKAAAEAAGLRPGHPRLPLQRLKGPRATEVHRAMAAHLARAGRR